jgi:hypothetical protein
MISIQMQQYVNASFGSGFDCNSIVGCYADGYELGKEAGAEDAREGRDHDSKCPPNDILSFCTGYKRATRLVGLPRGHYQIEDRGERIQIV